MTSTYQPVLVALSCLVAIVTAYTTLGLAGRLGVAAGATRHAWLAAGACAMGAGIWSMHFTGMLALRLRHGAATVPVTHDVAGVLLSLLVAILASGVALAYVGSRRPTRAVLGVAACLVGGSISAMHYLGMAALRGDLATIYHPALVVLSVAIGVGASVLGLGLAVRLRNEAHGVPTVRRGAAAVVLGLAIAGMHYTGMAAVRFVPPPGPAERPPAHTVLPDDTLGVGIAAGTLLLLVLLLASIVIDRRLRERLASAATHRRLYEDAEAARAEAAQASELLLEQAVELEQQLEATQALAAENEALLQDAQAANEALRASHVALAASEARFRELVEAAHEGVWALDGIGCTTYLNPRMCAMLGVHEADVVGRTIFDFLDPESAFEARTRFARPLRGLTDVQDLCFVRPDGGTLRGLVSVSPLVDAGGEVSGVLVLVHDATEQRRAEEALRESEARFRELFERSPLPMWVYDPETLRFLDVNEAAVQHYGWTREEFLAMSVTELHPEDHRDAPARWLEPLRAGGWRGRGVVEHVVHRTRHGRRCDVEVTSDSVTIAGRTARLVLLKDVTERLAAERALAESNERYSYVQRATNDVIWDHDVSTGRIVWSGGLHTALRYPPDEQAGPVEWWEARLHPDDRAQVLASRREVLREGVSWEAEYRFRRGDGTYAHVLDRGYVLRGARGAPVRFIGAMQDVSERESLAEQLRQAQRLETVGRLAGGVAHDFNNLLTVISANTEFALDAVPAGGTAAQDLREVLDATRRAEALTRQLLAFSRKQVWQPQVVDVNQTVAGLHRMFERLIGEDVRLATTLAPDGWPVLVDPGQLEQVLANLIVNARDAILEGGAIQLSTTALALDASTLQAYVAQQAARQDAVAQPALHTLAPGDYMTITVADSGTGIRADVLPHIFEPFFTTKPEGKGTGLGLATVYGIVKQAGGATFVVSAPGVGTRVTVLLPRHGSAEPVESLPARSTATPPGGSETVLLVEDEPAVRAVIHRLLHRAGYVVLEAAHGGEALAIWQERRAAGAAIDAVLTDAVMPVLGGRALAERLRDEDPDVRLVLMSGYTAETAGSDAAMARGAASAFLQKPLSGETLLRTLRAVLDR